MTNLEWCQQRALEYLDRGDTMNAFVSMMSDLRKNDDTRNHRDIELGAWLMLAADFPHNPEAVRQWILGFHENHADK